MKSSFLESDINLSKIISGKIIKKVEHIDNDACIQITFSDKSCIVVVGVPDKEFKAVPLFHYYNVSGEPVMYME